MFEQSVVLPAVGLAPSAYYANTEVSHPWPFALLLKTKPFCCRIDKT